MFEIIGRGEGARKKITQRRRVLREARRKRREQQVPLPRGMKVRR
jgi:hypothetical protein